DVDAGVVDEDIDAAELVRNALDHARDRRLVGDVGDHRNHPDTACGKLGSRCFRLGLIASDDGNIGAGIGESAGHAKPDSAIAARDDGNLALEVEQLCRHGRWLCQIRIRPTADSAAPYPAHWISLIMKLDRGQATVPVPWPIQSRPTASPIRPKI